MANNQANDRYNPPGIGQNDFDRVRFDEVEDDDLFWLTQSTAMDNAPYRKLNERQGYNTKTSIVADFGLRQEVFQRT